MLWSKFDATRATNTLYALQKSCDCPVLSNRLDERVPLFTWRFKFAAAVSASIPLFFVLPPLPNNPAGPLSPERQEQAN